MGGGRVGDGLGFGGGVEGVGCLLEVEKGFGCDDGKGHGALPLLGCTPHTGVDV